MNGCVCARCTRRARAVAIVEAHPQAAAFLAGTLYPRGWYPVDVTPDGRPRLARSGQTARLVLPADPDAPDWPERAHEALREVTR